MVDPGINVPLTINQNFKFDQTMITCQHCNTLFKGITIDQYLMMSDDQRESYKTNSQENMIKHIIQNHPTKTIKFEVDNEG